MFPKLSPANKSEWRCHQKLSTPSVMSEFLARRQLSGDNFPGGYASVRAMPPWGCGNNVPQMNRSKSDYPPPLPRGSWAVPRWLVRGMGQFCVYIPWGEGRYVGGPKIYASTRKRGSLDAFTPPPRSEGSRSGFVGEGRWGPQRHGWDCTQRDPAMQSGGRIECCENTVPILKYKIKKWELKLADHH